MTNVLASLSTLLAFAELIGTVGVPALLVIALVRKRHLITTALVAAIVFGVVFANPFGAVAEPSSEDARSLTPSREADGARHWLKLGGVPVAWFTPYDQPSQLGEMREQPKVRSEAAVRVLVSPEPVSVKVR